MPPEPSADLFFFAEVLPFFGRAALGSFDGAAAARDGAVATPPVAVVIRGGKKRLHARPTLSGAPMVATPTLPALGFPARRRRGEGGSRLYNGVSGVPVCASMGGGRAPEPARAGRRRRRGESVARALECAARGTGRPKYTARDSVSDRAPNSL